MAGKSATHAMAPQFRDIVVALMRSHGRNFRWCEVGNHPIKGRWTIHHERYDGATYKDLKICCDPCQQLPENQLLD